MVSEPSVRSTVSPPLYIISLIRQDPHGKTFTFLRRLFLGGRYRLFGTCLLCGAVLIGGVKRIASVSQIIVPFMAVIYIVFVLSLVICNITAVPAAFKTIVVAAFTPKAITGGAVGSMLVAMQRVLPAVSFPMKQDLVAHRSPLLPQRQKSRYVRDLSA